jgi:hypothetical protein
MDADTINLTLKKSEISEVAFFMQYLIAKDVE